MLAELAKDEVAATAAARAVSNAVAQLHLRIAQQVAAVVRSQRRLLTTSLLSEADILQHVTQKLLERPPENKHEQTPRAVVLGWVRAVAVNFMIEHWRKAKRFAALPAAGDDDSSPHAELPSPDRGAAEELGAAQDIGRLRRAAESLRKYKHMHETFLVLAEDPEVSGLELAERLGLICAAPPEPWPKEFRDAQKRAIDNAFQLRKRTLGRLTATLQDSE